MTRNSFDLKLQLLHEELITMSESVREQIENSVLALKDKNDKLAIQVITKDDLVDEYEKEIEEKCVRLIATEQPLAGDLRRIFITTKIVTDLERIGDHGVDIAKIAIALKDEEYIEELTCIPEMSKLVEKMLKGAIDVYINGNVKLAYEICKMDDRVDELYEETLKKLITAMRKDEKTIYQGSKFLLVCKFLERIGDHATNICEQIVYLETGEKLKLN